MDFSVAIDMVKALNRIADALEKIVKISESDSHLAKEINEQYLKILRGGL